MYRPRIIPCLLLRDKDLVKTKKFNKKRAKYLGDPINAVKIFNEKKADELIFLDILASKQKREPDYTYIKKIAEECCMPFAYGGGIKSLEMAQKVFAAGAEKVILNTAVLENPGLIAEISSQYGRQSVVLAVDFKKNLFGKIKIYNHATNKFIQQEITRYLNEIQQLGIGEIFVNAVDEDGAMSGFNLDLFAEIVAASNVPVVACGGAGSLEDFSEIVYKAKVSAVAAGSVFVYHGKHKAVLINYPPQTDLDAIFASYFQKIKNL